MAVVVATPETLALRELVTGHRDALESLFAKYGATNPRLFGSVARGEAGPDSDIDIMVDLLPEHLGVRRQLEDVLARPGISTPTYTALTVLRRWPGITSSELARRSFVRAQTMAETVSAMLESGLLRREKDPGHGRQMLLYITAEGDRMIDSVRDDVQELDAVLASALSEEDRRQLIRHLRACRDGLRARQGRVCV